METKLCPGCSAELPENAVICENCGMEISEAAEAGNEIPTETQLPAGEEKTEETAIPTANETSVDDESAEEHTEETPSDLSYTAYPVENTAPKKKSILKILIPAAAAVVLIAVIVLITSLTGRHDPDKLIGEWVDVETGAMELDFYENGSGKLTGDMEDLDLDWLDGIPFNWHTEKNKMTLDIGMLFFSESVDCEFEIKGGKLYFFPLEGNGEKTDGVVLRKKKKSDEKTDKDTATGKDTASGKTTGNSNDTDGKKENYADKVEIVNEIWSYSHNKWTDETTWTHLVIVKNNSDKTLSVSTSSLAYDGTGQLLGSGNGDAEIIPAGYTSFIKETLNVNGDIDDFDTTVKAAEANKSQSALQDLSCDGTESSNGAVLTIKNTGKSKISSINGYVLFYLNDQIMDAQSVYISSLESGDTTYEQVDSDEAFDSFKYYFTASRSVW